MLARRLTRDVNEVEHDAALENALTAAEERSRWRDPVEIAVALVEDWSSLRDGVRRRQIQHLIDHVTVRTGYKSATVTVHTAWGTRSPITAGTPRAVACEDPTKWLDGPAAVAFTGLDRSTIRDWRELGLLPNTRPIAGNRYLYARGDLELVLSAPRKGKLGIDHEAARALVERLPLVTS
jgi:hypothetical protein